MITIRRATLADAPAMSTVLIASIRDLCLADHHNDPAILSRWLANKTPEGVTAWFANPASTILVAERDGEIAAASAFNSSREITLNYVGPKHRFAGVSSALLKALEAALGAGPATLTSTETAHRFYLARGWSDRGPAQDHGGLTCFPMQKTLS